MRLFHYDLNGGVKISEIQIISLAAFSISAMDVYFTIEIYINVPSTMEHSYKPKQSNTFTKFFIINIEG